MLSAPCNMQDPQYRTTVAAMLAQQTADENQPSQFIVTTFHPQIIQQVCMSFGGCSCYNPRTASSYSCLGL